MISYELSSAGLGLHSREPPALHQLEAHWAESLETKNAFFLRELGSGSLPTHR